MNCEHKMTVYDQHTSDEICLNCGVAVLATDPTSLSLSCDENEEIGVNLSRDVFYETVDILQRLFIFSHSVAIQCASNASDLIAQQYSGLSRKLLIAFSIYEMLNLLDICMSPLSIAQACGLQENLILKAEKSLQRPVLIHPPVFFVSRVCGCLFLPFPFEKRIRTKVSYLQRSHFLRPESLIGAVILLQVKKERQTDKHFAKYPDINAQHLANSLGVTSGCLYRVMKEIEGEFNQLSLY